MRIKRIAAIAVMFLSGAEIPIEQGIFKPWSYSQKLTSANDMNAVVDQWRVYFAMTWDEYAVFLYFTR